MIFVLLPLFGGDGDGAGEEKDACIAALFFKWGIVAFLAVYSEGKRGGLKRKLESILLLIAKCLDFHRFLIDFVDGWMIGRGDG